MKASLWYMRSVIDEERLADSAVTRLAVSYIPTINTKKHVCSRSSQLVLTKEEFPYFKVLDKNQFPRAQLQGGARTPGSYHDAFELLQAPAHDVPRAQQGWINKMPLISKPSPATAPEDLYRDHVTFRDSFIL